MLCQLQGRGARGVGNRDHHVDVVVGPLAANAIAQLAPHLDAGAVDIGAIENRVRACQVDMLEDARRQQRRIGARLGMDVAVHVDEDRLARGQVAMQLEAAHVERHRLGGDHHLLAVTLVAGAEHHRANAMGVTEGHQADAVDDRHRGIAATAAPVHAAHRIEDVARREMQPCLPSSWAKTLSSTSESELVLMWRRSEENSSCLICSELVRLPL